MAAPVSEQTTFPKFTVHSDYTVSRLGPSSTVRLVFQECVYILEVPVPVETAGDVNGDGAFEVLTVPAWGGRTDLVGRIVALPDSTTVGTITGATQLLVTPEQTNPDGTTTPAVYAAQCTLGSGSATDLTGKTVALVIPSPFGGAATYQPHSRGLRWELYLPGGQVEAMQRMGVMLSTAYVNAGRALLTQLGLSSGVTDQQLADAVTALTQVGTNLDGFLSDQAMQLEADRMAGLVPWLTTTGKAPTP